MSKPAYSHLILDGVENLQALDAMPFIEGKI